MRDCEIRIFRGNSGLNFQAFHPNIVRLYGLNDGFCHVFTGDTYSDSRPDQASTSSTDFSRSARNLSSTPAGIVAPAAIAWPPPIPPYFGDRSWRIFRKFTGFWTSCSVALVETLASPDRVRIVSTVSFGPLNSFIEKISDEHAPGMLLS